MENTMNCPQCSNEMILTRATAHGSDYYYCRDCKQELGEMIKTELVSPECALSSWAAFDALAYKAHRDSLIFGTGKIKLDPPDDVV